MKENKDKKVAIRQWEKIVKASAPPFGSVDFKFESGEVITVAVKPRLTLGERTNFVRDAADICFDGDEYRPYYVDFAIKYSILNYYTNINIDTKADKVWDLVETTGIMDKLFEIIKDNRTQMVADVYEEIEWRKAQILKSSSFDQAMEDLSFLINTIAGAVENFNAPDDNAGYKLEDIMAAVASIKNADSVGVVKEMMHLREEAENKEV